MSSLRAFTAAGILVAGLAAAVPQTATAAPFCTCPCGATLVGSV